MQNNPTARHENIVVQELKNEILVCDLTNNHVFCLNQTAGEVWKLCNGENSVDEIEKILSRKFGSKVGQEMILLTLDKLSSEYLLTEKFSSETFLNQIPRREIIKKAGLFSMIALPMISSLAMPTSSLAASGVSGLGGPCTTNGNCQSGLSCSSGTCLKSTGQPCSVNSECATTFCTDGVCCNSSCTGLCQACDLPGNFGACTPIPAGQDIDNECPGATTCNGAGICSGALGTACTNGFQCLSGFCADGVCCDTSCSGVCESCTSGVLSPGSCFDLSLIGPCP